MSTRRAWAFALGCGVVVCGAACNHSDPLSPPPTGELVLALQTDMDVPKDVDKVRIRIEALGNTVFSNDYQVGPDGLRIPATLGVLPNPDHPSAPATIQVIAFQKGRPRVLRETITTIPSNRVATLRVPIQWLCDESAEDVGGHVESICGTGQTCIAGSCAPSEVDSTALPAYAPSEIFGGGDGTGNGSCFDVAHCFEDGADVLVDTSTCSFVSPFGNADLNVALQLPHGDGQCGTDPASPCLIPLDSAPSTGWVRGGDRADTANGESIQLPSGVCDRLQRGKVLGIRASARCPAKTDTLPTCGPWSSVGSSPPINTGGNDAGIPVGDGSGTCTPVGQACSTTDGSRGSGCCSGVCNSGICGDPAACLPDGQLCSPSAPCCSNSCDRGVCGRGSRLEGGTCTAPAAGTSCAGATFDLNPRAACHYLQPPMEGSCPNLMNLQMITSAGGPGAMLMHTYGPAGCGEMMGWYYETGATQIGVCAQTCAMLTSNEAAKVQLVYGCPTIEQGQGPPDGGYGGYGGGSGVDSGAGGYGNGPPDPPVAMKGVPISDFGMGCAASDPACAPDEYPYHVVSVPDFSIDQYEVNQGAYDSCIRAGVCNAPGCGWDPVNTAWKPVICVSWDQARTYCNWMGKRLPSEAEWEKAARGASGSIYPWGDGPSDCIHANTLECAFSGPQAGGGFALGGSPYGVFDMAGNVWEWVWDRYDPGYYMISPSYAPLGPTDGLQRVTKGGSFGETSVEARSSKRRPKDPVSNDDSTGFRCAEGPYGPPP